MSRAKQVGTAAETAVVRAAHRYGLTTAARLPLYGGADRGDVRLTREAICEVKSGKQANNPPPKRVSAWLRETERERENAGARFGVLVTKRAGVGLGLAELWPAHMRLPAFLALHDASRPVALDDADTVVTVPFGQVLTVLAYRAGVNGHVETPAR